VAFLGGQATGIIGPLETFMRRRSFMTAALAASALPSLARAQAAPAAAPAPDRPIQPTTPLEFAFVAALSDERMRPIFRRYLLDTSVALALTGEGNDAAPLEVEVREGWRGGAIFTTAARLDEVLGVNVPRITLNGRAALERLRGKNAVINYRLVPMLTLDDEDIEIYLATEGSASAGPTQ
jgi:hypothetical protein